MFCCKKNLLRFIFYYHLFLIFANNSYRIDKKGTYIVSLIIKTLTNVNYVKNAIFENNFEQF